MHEPFRVMWARLRTCAWLACAVVGLRASPVWAADCNANRVDDSIELLLGHGTDCNENGVPDECEVVPLSLEVEDVVTLPQAPRVVRLADMDGDGRLDLIVGGWASRAPDSGIYVSLARGKGAFSEAVGYEAPGRLLDLAVADIDADGDRDVVTASRDGMLLVFQNRAQGALDLLSRISVPGEPRDVKAADLTGDGLPELIAGNRESGGVVVLENRGDGMFDPASALPGGDGTDDLAIYDFDRDGDLDLASLDRSSSTVFLHENDGDGIFALPTSVSVPAVQPGVLRSADLNGDGYGDLVVVSTAALHVLRNDGQGGFTEAEPYAGGGTRVRLSDFDLDGDIDLALARSPEGLALRYNNGAASLDIEKVIDVGRIPTDWIPGDLDGDGDLDLAVVRSTGDRISIAWNRDPTGLVLRSETVDGIASFPEGGGPAADFNGDGAPDILARGVVLNDGAGTLIPGTRAVAAPVSGAADSGDVDGDGDLDVVSTDSLEDRLRVYLNEGDGEFSTFGDVVAGNYPIHLRLADLDGDQALDAVVANIVSSDIAVLFNDGEGRFEVEGRGSYPVAWRPHVVDTADFDGDGRVDIVTCGAEVLLLLNAGERMFRPRTASTQLAASRHFVAADVDRDGDFDVVSVNQGLASVSILSNDGDGTFGDPLTVPVGRQPHSVSVVDVDADGLTDLVTANETSHNLSILLGSVDGRFESPRHIRVGRGPRFVVPADLDRDGDIDLVSLDHGDASLTVLYQQTEGEVPSYLLKICTPGDLHRASTANPDRPGERLVKYLLPAREDARVGPLIQNTRRFLLQRDFLIETFPGEFASLTGEEFNRLVAKRATREFFSGEIARFLTRRGLVHGFTVVADFADPGEVLTVEEMGEIHDQLEEIFRLEPLVYAPISREAAAVAATWVDPGFEIVFDRSGLDPQARFLRGDVNADGAVAVPDAIQVVRYLFLRAEKPRCTKAADADDSGKVNLGDALAILGYLFRGAGPLPAPFPACGTDGTVDALECASTCAVP